LPSAGDALDCAYVLLRELEVPVSGIIPTWSAKRKAICVMERPARAAMLFTSGDPSARPFAVSRENP
jgi:hypothetical protein